ncbi:MAG: FAD-dependent oxidoreductase [Burkholderiaceae bacterium]|nr:FAD-dependent oxidoreductase [Burkholderiaceae bacterium]
MGEGALRLSRRGLLLGSAAGLLGCSPGATAPQGGWVGASHGRGHRLREPKSGALPAPQAQHRAQVLILGAGVSGLAAARSFTRAGVGDVQLLELEDQAGGNSRGHQIGGLRCPLGAHYLPLPGAEAPEVVELLEELGLSRLESGRRVYDERHLCHSPQERLFYQGAWVEGLLPPAEGDAATLAQYRRFARLVEQVRSELSFAMPSLRARGSAGLARLDAVPFAQWLQAQGLVDAKLRWYLDYCCRDDFGAGTETVSAWAGLHYFASRHGFHPPGDESEPEPVLTWAQGNAWLTERLAAPQRERLHGGMTVLQVDEQRHQVEVLAWNEVAQRIEQWTAQTVVFALPLFIAARLLRSPLPALHSAAAKMRYAPWLVANLRLREPLLQRVGAAPAWDNVVYGGSASALGYVDASHQILRSHTGPTVLTAYHALPVSQRGALLNDPWSVWADRVLADLLAVHPDLPTKTERIDLMRYGHAMSIPVPGLHTDAALRSLSALRGRLRFAHADLAGYSVFEEAFCRGMAVGT